MKYFLLFLSKCKIMQRMLGSLKFYVYTCICSTFTIYSQRIRLSCLMKQPLMINRDTGFFEMCPKFFLLKMKFKSTTCICMSVRYINNFCRVVGFVKFLIKSRVIVFVPIQAKGLRQTRFLDLLPRSFRGKSYIKKKDSNIKDFNDKRLALFFEFPGNKN